LKSSWTRQTFSGFSPRNQISLLITDHVARADVDREVNGIGAIDY